MLLQWRLRQRVSLAHPPVLLLQASAQSAPQGRGGRGFGGGGGTPVVGYPRGYSVQVSTDGTNWGKPVAEGKGDGAHTTITFAPIRAKFVKITETETPADPAAWSIRNLRIYEAPASR